MKEIKEYEPPVNEDLLSSIIQRNGQKFGYKSDFFDMWLRVYQDFLIEDGYLSTKKYKDPLFELFIPPSERDKHERVCREFEDLLQRDIKSPTDYWMGMVIADEPQNSYSDRLLVNKMFHTLWENEYKMNIKQSMLWYEWLDMRIMTGTKSSKVYKNILNTDIAVMRPFQYKDHNTFSERVIIDFSYLENPKEYLRVEYTDQALIQAVGEFDKGGKNKKRTESLTEFVYRMRTVYPSGLFDISIPMPMEGVISVSPDYI